ncbi:hypothetical protein ACLOJK_021048 [Asimina triloba]
MAASSLSYPSVSISRRHSFVRAISSQTSLLPIIASPKSPSQRFPSIVVASNGRRDRGVAITESERRMLVERFGFDPNDFADEPPSRQKSRKGGEDGKASKGKRGAPPPPKEPKPPRTTHRLLRVLGGKARRRKLLSPKGMHVRPMMEVVKGATFDILQTASGSPASLSPGRWLDLYCGTGSVGIEALSRGCSEVVRACRLKTVQWKSEKLKRAINKPEDGSFDYISVTPPYTAVVEYPLKTDMPGSCGHLIKIADRHFGRTNLAIYGPTWAKKKRKSEIQVETIAQKEFNVCVAYLVGFLWLASKHLARMYGLGL